LLNYPEKKQETLQKMLTNLIRSAPTRVTCASLGLVALAINVEVTLKISNGIGKIRMYGEVFKNINTNCSRIQR